MKLDGIDECKTLTAAQQKELDIDSSASAPLEVTGVGKAPTCRYRSQNIPLFSYTVALITEKGIDFWAEGGNLAIEPMEVSGFPAKQVKLAGTKDAGCSTAVDTADGQNLYVTFLPITREFSPEQQCANAKKAAELALATIQTLR
ncbi:hypothetical protein Lesp02_54600 [Lentzea sp. NBRC 105346]|nr:hypothetical protein Lesp02_54600 [Lentzea sp. NBRC 105346]